MQNKENFSAILFQDVILLALAINDDGIYDSEKYTVSCSDALDSGLAFSQNFRNIAVGTDPDCDSVFHALSAGLLSGNSNIWNIGNSTFTQLKYAVRVSGADGGIFIQNCRGNIKLIPCSVSGHPLLRKEEAEFLDALNPDKCIVREKKGKLTDSSVFSELYISETEKKFSRIENIPFRINSSNPQIRKIFRNTSPVSDSDFFRDVTFNISDDGTRVSAYSCESGFIFYEKLLLLCCTDEFEKGNDIPLPHSFPVIADKLASEYNQNIYRYDPFSENASDISRKDISLEYPFLYDAADLVYRILRMMTVRKRSLKELLSLIPDFTTAVKYININNNPEETIKHIHEKSENDVCCSHDTGRIIAKKSKSGKSLILYAESYSSETADELCSSWLSDYGIR